MCQNVTQNAQMGLYPTTDSGIPEEIFPRGGGGFETGACNMYACVFKKDILNLHVVTFSYA